MPTPQTKQPLTPLELRPSGMIVGKDKTGNTRFIAHLVPHGPDSQLDAEDMAYGELLVSASNSQEQLVALLTDIEQWFAERNIQGGIAPSLQARIREALAATGDSQAQSGPPSASKGVQP